MSERLYECEVEGCDWENPDWRYGFADAGATWAYHMSDHKRRDQQTGGRAMTDECCYICRSCSRITCPKLEPSPLEPTYCPDCAADSLRDWGKAS